MSSDLVITLATAVASVVALLLQRLHARLKDNTATTEATGQKVDNVAAALQHVVQVNQTLTTVTLERDWLRAVFRHMRGNPNCAQCLQEAISALDRRKAARQTDDAALRLESDQ